VRAAVAALRNATRAGGRTRNEHSIAAAIFGSGIEGRRELMALAPVNSGRAVPSEPAAWAGVLPAIQNKRVHSASGICIVCGSLAGADQLGMR